ncbi:MAG: sulfatase-like hydrolase/transferase [Myxococcota bacterium]
MRRRSTAIRLGLPAVAIAALFAWNRIDTVPGATARGETTPGAGTRSPGTVRPASPPLPAPRADAPPPARPAPLVALIVLDDVRADRTSLCGHARPTTPFLVETCEEPGSQCRCRAYAPGSWTIPSHASFFTGLEVQEHGVGSPSRPDERTPVFYRTLPASIPTLAETMAERGFRTVAISGNPVLDERSGLLRGFEARTVADSFSALQGEALVEVVRASLQTPDPQARPLFLFVNVSDAHEPWQPVPEGLDWLPRRRHLRFEDTLDAYRARFMRGELSPQEAEALMRHVADVYDFGIFRADRTLRRLVETLRETGWLAGPHRIVITSDHGELLGEAGALGHGAALLYEGLSRVPLVVLSSGEAPASLPDPAPALSVYDLLRDDGTPRPRPVRAAAFRAPGWQKRYGTRWGRHDGAALWHAGARAMLVDGAFLRFVLPLADDDPKRGSPLADGLDRTELEAIAQALEARVDAPLPDGSEAISAHLRALGYVE